MSKTVLDEDAIKRAITRMTYEIIERNKGLEDIIIVGIKTRGEYLGNRITNRLKELEGIDVPFISLDISHYRDDVVLASANEDKQPAISTKIGRASCRERV